MPPWIVSLHATFCILTLSACDSLKESTKPSQPTNRAQKLKDERLLQVKRPAMAEPVIHDVVELPEDEEPTMWDIAQTFPAYDWSINVFHRDGLTQEEKNHFLLTGDGSQTRVEIKQISEKPPLKVEMSIGPIHDGYGFRKPKLHYTFKRVKGGWRRLGWYVTYHGPSIGGDEEAPALSEEKNREKIEKITGKPYLDEVELASANSAPM
jgi:hypothetical protein